jgi:hypothetical protein
VVTDEDSRTLRGLSATITRGYHRGRDTLAFVTPLPFAGLGGGLGGGGGGGGGGWNASSGSLMVSGNGTVGEYQAIVRSLAFATTSDRYTPDDRVVTITLTDDTRAESAAATTTVAVLQRVSITRYNCR